ncbi:MAG: hypothetical protein JWP97_3717 [Labilithrix sp.]|nr:hypothetical protein [Labilithrix sp.]
MAIIAVGAVSACASFSAVDGPADASDLDARPLDAGDLDVATGDGPSDAEDIDARVPPDGSAPKLLAFVTAGGFGDVTTVAAADTKCKLEAAGRAAGRFVAWYSSATAAAPDRLRNGAGALVDGPWYRPDGKRVVATRLGLTQTKEKPLENPINVTLLNTTMGGGVWTGTRADGSRGTMCPVPPGGTPPTTGTSASVDGGWTDQTFFTASCGASLPLYCLQVE